MQKMIQYRDVKMNKISRSSSHIKYHRKISFRSSTQLNFSTSYSRKDEFLAMSGDKYDPSASDYLSWDPSTPVLIKMEEEGPGSYPPKLVQTFLREVVLIH